MEPERVKLGDSTVDTSNYHSNPSVTLNFSPQPAHLSPASTPSGSMVSSLEDRDFSSQAALTVARATQTNNIVNSRSYYDIMFKTATSGIIKTIDFDFPPGTYVGAALLVEAVGIGPGKISHSGVTSTGQTITYTVTNAVNVPAFTTVRIQLANINNPSTPSDSLKVTITTKNAASNPIDGPTSTLDYSISPLGTSAIQDNAVISSKIADGTIGSTDLNPTLFVSRILGDNARGNSFGWNPDGMEVDFIIIDEAVVGPNAALINVGDTISNSQCEALGSLTGFFTIRCNTPPPQGSELRYTVTNLPVT